MRFAKLSSAVLLCLWINSSVCLAATNTPTPTILTTPASATSHVVSDNMWTMVVQNFSLPHYTNTPQVQKQIRWFQANPKIFDQIANQGSPYLYFIYQQVTQRHLPGELVLLPMIESVYDPFAYSWVGAAGLWQMMPATGTNFGLKQNFWYDGRKDVFSSTKAALDYLTYLRSFFNQNWLLAIAAYNSGEGTVQKAIDRNASHGKGTAFWNLALPMETQNYVPRLLALAEIVSHPAQYGFTLPFIPYAPYFSMVTINKQMDLTQIAKMAGISMDVLYKLNPAYSHWTTDPKGPNHILLPVSAIPKFEASYNAQNSAHGVNHIETHVISNPKAPTPSNGINSGPEQAMLQSAQVATKPNVTAPVSPVGSTNTQSAIATIKVLPANASAPSGSAANLPSSSTPQ